MMMVAVLLIVRLITLTPPGVRLLATADTSVTLTGRAPAPAWPSSGQAAFKVLGVGSLQSSGVQAPTPTASLAKVMTAYLILEHDPLTGTSDGFTVTITPAEAQAEQADAAQDESVVPVDAGEILNERQLLEALLIPSGDNIARILAVRQAGSIAAFLREMNAEARALGMTRTTYTDPSGYYKSTVSTASDQLKIFTRAMRFAVFRKIVEMPAVTLPVAGTLGNYDPLIDDGFYGKTGSDSAAEGCLAFFHYIRVAGRRITEVGVVMHQGTGPDTSVILDAAGNAATTLAASVTPALRARTLLDAGTSAMRAIGAGGGTVTGVTDRRLRVIGWGGTRERLTITRAKVATGLAGAQRIGEIRLAGPLPTPRGAAPSTGISAARALSAPGLGWRISHLL